MSGPGFCGKVFIGFICLSILMPTLIDMVVACGATCFARCLQGVPKKKGDSGKKVLAKILGQILSGAKKAEKVTKSWWEIFSVSIFPCWLWEWAGDGSRTFVS